MFFTCAALSMIESFGVLDHKIVKMLSTEKSNVQESVLNGKSRLFDLYEVSC